LVLHRATADDRCNMASFGCPLTDRAIIELLEEVVVLTGPRARALDIADDPGDVLESQSGRPYRICVADSLVERTVLPEGVVPGESVPRHRVLHPRPLLERRPLVI